MCCIVVCSIVVLCVCVCVLHCGVQYCCGSCTGHCVGYLSATAKSLGLCMVEDNTKMVDDCVGGRVFPNSQLSGVRCEVGWFI